MSRWRLSISKDPSPPTNHTGLPGIPGWGFLVSAFAALVPAVVFATALALFGVSQRLIGRRDLHLDRKACE